MEVCEFALAVVEATDLETKLRSAPDALTDHRPGEGRTPPAGPGRPASLRIVPGRKARIPPVEGMADPRQRVRILHGFANHELQAVELFAWALLAFPAAPAGFRAGLLGVLADEQRHTRLYIARVEALGDTFGTYPVSGYFWSKAAGMTSPARFVAAMSLTFECVNLDHSLDYAAAARAHGDEASALVMERIHRDEIGHVRFGAEWLARFKASDESLWDAYRRNLEWPLRPALAKGPHFHAQARRDAGLDEDFVSRVDQAGDDAANGT